MYKKAARLKLRFATASGSLSVEQLWDLSRTKLKSFIEAQYKIIQKSSSNPELAFLGDVEVDDKELLRFEILKDVYTTKVAEAEEAKKASDIKAHNEKIMALIAEKEDAELRGKSADELRAMLK